MPIPATYEVQVRDRAGNILAICEDYLYLQWQSKVLRPGQFQIRLQRQSKSAALLTNLGYQVVVYRTARDNVRRQAFSGLVEHLALARDASGQATDIWQFSGRDLMAYLDYGIIIPPAGQAFDDQTGAAETVAKHFVNTTLAKGGAFPIAGLTIETDYGRGKSVTVPGRYQNLLLILQDIANAAGQSFRVVALDAGGDQLVWLAQPGQDHSPGNSQGNAAVIFSSGLGHLVGLTYEVSAEASRNTIVVGGDGTGIARLVKTYVNTADYAIVGQSRAEFLSLPSGGTIAALATAAAARLVDTAVATTVGAEAQPLPTLDYQADYDLGDTVQVDLPEWSFKQNLMIVELQMMIQSRTPERIGLIFGSAQPNLWRRVLGMQKNQALQVIQ